MNRTISEVHSPAPGMGTHLWTKCASVGSAHGTKEIASDNTGNRLMKVEAVDRAKDADGEGSNVAGHGPPHEESIHDMGRSLLFFWDAVDSLSFDTHLLVEPHFSLAHVAKRRPGILNISGAGNLGLWCHRASFDLGGAVLLLRDNRMLAGLNILLVDNTIRHVCFDGIEVLEV